MDRTIDATLDPETDRVVWRIVRFFAVMENRIWANHLGDPRHGEGFQITLHIGPTQMKASSPQNAPVVVRERVG